VGVPPLDVECTAELPDGSWDRTVWLWGDGETSEGDSAVHTYQVPGLYAVSVFLEGYVPPAPYDDMGDLSERLDGLVSVCGEPVPRFTFIDKGGRDYQMVNQTSVSTPLCLESVHWEVFRGERMDGNTLMTFEFWEPRFELPEDGQFTIVLTAGGVGGDSAAALQIDAKFNLTEEINRTTASSCAVAPAGAGWLALGVGLLGLRRRKRFA